ncbi:hypothetical protein C2E23DRAFT_886438 [Lenzites betulinus]|nr:hypothetical protein C2E23DRAFT_886438 [Lenzites betulinus]
MYQGRNALILSLSLINSHPSIVTSSVGVLLDLETSPDQARLWFSSPDYGLVSLSSRRSRFRQHTSPTATPLKLPLDVA